MLTKFIGGGIILQRGSMLILLKEFNFIQGGVVLIGRVVGDGCSTMFLRDPWLEGGLLNDEFKRS